MLAYSSAFFGFLLGALSARSRADTFLLWHLPSVGTEVAVLILPKFNESNFESL